MADIESLKVSLFEENWRSAAAPTRSRGGRCAKRRYRHRSSRPAQHGRVQEMDGDRLHFVPTRWKCRQSSGRRVKSVRCFHKIEPVYENRSFPILKVQNQRSRAVVGLLLAYRMKRPSGDQSYIFLLSGVFKRSSSVPISLTMAPRWRTIGAGFSRRPDVHSRFRCTCVWRSCSSRCNPACL